MARHSPDVNAYGQRRGDGLGDLNGDKAYDSDPHRKRLRRRGINLLSPHRKNHQNVNRQDDRLWDRYRRRHIVERTFAWLGAYSRLGVRYENHISIFVAFLELGFAMLTLRQCL